MTGGAALGARPTVQDISSRTALAMLCVNAGFALADDNADMPRAARTAPAVSPSETSSRPIRYSRTSGCKPFIALNVDADGGTVGVAAAFHCSSTSRIARTRARFVSGDGYGSAAIKPRYS